MKYILWVTSLFIFINVSAQLKIARLFSDHMVLQRNQAVPIWGWANANEKVTVSIASQTLTVKAAKDGKWKVVINPVQAGGPYQLNVTANSGNISVTDILFGDVWLCSGQSNMEFTVKQAADFVNEKADADFNGIRHFFVSHTVTLKPEEDLPNGEWKICSPQTVGDFTAVGYFFAKELYKHSKVPIGLLHASWGGSQIEGWISKEGMLSSDEFKEYASHLPKNWDEADQMLERNIKEKLFGNAAKEITADDELNYIKPGYDFSHWHTAGTILSQWDWLGIWAWRGNGYMAKSISIPAEMVAMETTLGLAACYSQNEIYINGKKIWSGTEKGPKQIKVPPFTWIAGSNSLVIKANKVIEPSGYGMGLMGSAKDMFVAAAGLSVPIPTDNWKLMPAFAEPHTYAHLSNNVGTAIYNGMIAPLVPYAVRGVLWYQGEANTGRAYQYRKAFPLLIEDWRKKWGTNFDFYYVQLANHGDYQSSNEGSGWAELREAQTMTLKVPKTGMAVTIDIGDAKNIHPTNKQDVGKRLAANALKLTYGENIIFSGPMYQSVRFDQDKAILSFINIGSGLMVKDRFGYVKGFEIAGEDKKFYYAKAEIAGDKIIVYHPLKMKAVAVRYGWADSPDDVNMYNKEGFPMCPFRTDNWKGITEDVKFK